MQEIQTLNDVDRLADFVKEYKNLLERFSKLAAQDGIEVRPYKDSQNLMFSKMPVEKWEPTINHLRKYVESCSITVQSGESLLNNATLVWQMLKSYGLSPQSDIMDKIKSTDVVEFYNRDNVQIFRNLNFFKICSYSFDEILSMPWWELYNRDEEITKLIFQEAVELFTANVKKTKKIDIKPHYLEEIASAYKYKMEIVINYISPLTSDGQIQAALVVEEAKLFSN